MKYEKKYLKYKNKYLFLKKQIGGSRIVRIYDKKDKKKLLYEIELDVDDTLEILIDNIIEKIRSKDSKEVENIERIEIFEKGNCINKLNGITDKMTDFCMSIINKSQFESVIMNSGVIFTTVKRPFTNEKQKIYKSNLIVTRCYGTFDGIVNEGIYINSENDISLIKGEGMFKCNGITLIGSFEYNKLTGSGEKIIYDQDGIYDEYKGIFENNNLVVGTIIYKKHHEIEKQIGKFNLKHGYEILENGKIIRNNGKIEEGTFKNNLLDGIGKITLGDLEEEGTYINGINQNSNKKIIRVYGDVKNGKGTILYLDGVVLHGDFQNDIFIKGIKKYPNRDRDEGTFLNNNLNGQGKKYIYENDVWYEGNFTDGIINGEGYIIYGSKIIEEEKEKRTFVNGKVQNEGYTERFFK